MFFIILPSSFIILWNKTGISKLPDFSLNLAKTNQVIMVKIRFNDFQNIKIFSSKKYHPIYKIF